MKNGGMLMLLVVFNGCSSAPKSVFEPDRAGEEKVVLESGDSSLKDALPFQLKDHRYVSVGFVTISGDHRTEAGVKIATASARMQIAKTISARLESFLQSSSEGTSGDSQALREVISEVSKMDSSEWMIGTNYTQKVKVYSETGVPRLEYRIWSSVSLAESTYKAQVLQAIKEREGKINSSAAFQRAVDKNWNTILGSDSKEDARSSASTVSQDNE